ncbi:MAG: Ig-like domain-containing protein, partial [Longimicrobiales bacterium]|nr:Ig-like domain-containing protein [Longimicrobiales bacterium]
MNGWKRTGALRLLLVVAVAGCGGSSTDVQEPVPTTLTLSDSAIVLTFLGETRRLSATVLDQSGSPIQEPVTWSSADEDVATVTSTGVVRAESNGGTRVTASAGGVSASVEISVDQRASFLAVVSGDDQTGIAGTELPEPLVVRAQDRGGSPVEGVAVTFAPDPNSGSVSPGSATSGADGTVSTRWTLGTEFGPQRVVATGTDVSDAELNAFAGSETPTPDLRPVDPVSVDRPDPSTFDTVVVRSVVRNEGDADALGVTVQLRIDGIEVASTELATVASMSDATVEFPDVGPLSSGTRAV